MRRPKSASTLKRKGLIESWQGTQLTLNNGQRDIVIDQQDIVKLTTSWPIEYQNAIEHASQGKTDLAIQNYQAAVQAETRPWAKSIIRAKLIGELMLVDQVESAMAVYLEILQQDPNSRFVVLAPLVWSNSARQVGKADQWIVQSQPALQLVGASWCLSGPKRKQSIEALEQLVDDIDPRISSLARAQLWRTRINASQRQLEVWQDQIDQMPLECQAGPRMTLANLQARSQLTDQATENWMKVVTLHSDQPSLVAHCLFLAAEQMRGQNHPSASTLLNELKSRYPQSNWARQLKTNSQQ